MASAPTFSRRANTSQQHPELATRARDPGGARSGHGSGATFAGTGCAARACRDSRSTAFSSQRGRFVGSSRTNVRTSSKSEVRCSFRGSSHEPRTARAFRWSRSITRVSRRRSPTPASAAAIIRNALGSYARRLDRLFLSTLVASESAAAELRGAGVTRTVRVPLGVDLSTFAPWRRARATGNAATAWPPGARAARRLRRPTRAREGAGDRDRRMAAIRPGADARRSLIVGQGPLLQQLQSLAPPVHRFAFCPFRTRERTSPIFSPRATRLLAPSPVETFGLAALEALACGTPVITADRGGVAEQVRRSNGGVCFVPATPSRSPMRCDVASVGSPTNSAP